MKDKNKYKMPNPFIYFLFKSICKFISKFIFNTKIIRNESKGVNDGYVVLANHESKIDFINMAAAIDRRASLVISNSFYQTSSIKGLMDMIQVIPKQQFQTAPGDIKKMRKAVDNNMPLSLYPVGLMTEDGASSDPGKSIAKLVKFLKKDVYIGLTKGSYLTQPKWSKVRRKGKITLDIYRLFTKEEVQELDDETIYRKIRENIDYDAYANQMKDKVVYKHGDNVEGLEYVLYQCPKCGKEFVIQSKDTNKLTCIECGYEVYADKYGLLNGNDIIYNSPSEWSRHIKNDFKEFIINNPEYELYDNVTISIINNKTRKLEVVGSGEVKVNKENINLTGRINKQSIDFKFTTSNYPMLPFIPGKQLEIQDGNTIYLLTFENKYKVMKFINFLKVVQEL